MPAVKEDMWESHQSALEKVGVYKMKVIERMVADDKLTKLLFYPVPDATFRESLTKEQRRGLIYSNIYPYKFNPEIVQEQTTFVGVEMGAFRGRTPETHEGQLTFHVYTHQSIMRTDVGVRQDVILAELGRLFDRKQGVGMGEMRFLAAPPIITHQGGFGGYAVTFEIVDLR